MLHFGNRKTPLLSVRSMLQKGFLFSSLFFSLLLLLPRAGSAAKGPADSVSWSALEGEVLHVLKRYSTEEALSPSAPLEKRIGFYLDAGLWSSAEQLLQNTPEREARRLLMTLYTRQGRFDPIYAAYQNEPSLFLNDPALLAAAGQGAFQRKSYSEALAILESISLSGPYAPHRYYLSALAFFALDDKSRFEETMERWIQWSDEHPGSPWGARAHLLNGYYHLSQKSYDRAFASLGQLFGKGAFADLAMLGIGWSYFEMGSPDNLMSILDGVEEEGSGSRHDDRLFQMLSRYQMSQGDLPGAVGTGERARRELQRRIERIRTKVDQLRRGETAPSPALPPGSLLQRTLLRLQRRIGEQQEITYLISQVNLFLRQTAVSRLREEERAAQKEEEKLAAELARRCMTLRSAPAEGSGGSDPLYLQARTAALQGKKGEAEAALKRLLDQTPAGPAAEEATFRLGELAFERGEYAEARIYYQPLVDRPESYLHRMALYKSAWSHYRSGHPKEVIPIVFQLWFPSAREGESETGSLCRSTPSPEERQEHLRLLTLALRSEGGAARLVDWVREKSPAEGFSLFSEMVKYEEGSGRKKEALQLIQAWVSAYPLYGETPFLHRAMIDLYNEPAMASSPEAIQVRIGFIENYRPGSVWTRENRPEQVERVKPLLKEQLRFLMTYFHVEAKKAQRVALYQKVLPWYDLYLEIFPAEKETGEVRFLYAEVLSEMKEERRSAESYRASAYVDPPHPLASEAAYREILILERIYAPSDPDLWEGYSRFIQGFPSDTRTAQIYLKQAEVAFQEKDYDKSRQFAEVVAMEEGERGCGKESQRNCALWMAAQKLIVQGYLNGQEYPQVIKHLNRLLSLSTQEKSPFPEKEVTSLRNLLVLSYYQQGEALKQQGKTPEAANSFWAAYREDDRTEIAPLALFEAASLWAGGEEKKKAEEAFVAFTGRYPQSALYHPALLRLAALYEETERPKEAAQIYETAGRMRNDPAFSAQALGQAMALYEKMEEWEKVYLLSLQWVERAQGNKERQIEGIVRGAEAKLKLGQEKTAEKMLSDLVRIASQETTKKKPAAARQNPSFYLAKAHLLLADIEIKRYEEIKLVTPLEKNLQKKKNLFDRLLRNYGQAADYPSPALVLAATHRMGEVFEEFSESLLKSERPAKLSAEEREAYDRLLKEQALPYLEKAEEAYRQNIDWAKKAGVENEWVEKSRERFDRIHQQTLSQNKGALYR
ncbi:MAG: tetratricopeptide repeat protein [Candidatus Manganitrophaceae bacterium]|nr:MAG: tetratricopeptide repeat protein [Candidatus Manganitrophaceae bacterium]